MTPAFTHLALHVRDLEACIGFYREFCAMEIVHDRKDGTTRVVWLAEPGRESEFIFVLIPGGPGRFDQGDRPGQRPPVAREHGLGQVRARGVF